MAKIKGTVSKASKGKFGYFLMLDGNDFYYNTKFEPKCGEGDVVGIEYDPKGPTRGNVKRVQILEDNTGGYANANSESGGGGGNFSSGSRGGGSSSNAGGDRQDSIITQHSQEMAISAAALIISNDAYAIKGKPDEKRVQIEGLIDELTAKFFLQAEKPRDTVLKGAAEIEADAADTDDSDSDDSWSDDDEWS